MLNNNPNLALFGVGLASFLGCVDFTIVNTALPDIQAEFSSSLSLLQWVMNIFVIALSSMMVTMGRLGDIFSHERVFYTGVIVFGLSSVLAALSPNIDVLIIARLIQGISCAILFTNSGAIISHIFPADKQGHALGVLFGINGLGLALGPFLGGLLVDYMGWRWIFYINIPIIILSVFACVIAIPKPEHGKAKGSLDIPGAILVTLILGCLSVLFTQGSTWGWASSTSLSFVGIIALFSLGFVYVESKAVDPIVNFRILRNPQFSSSSIASFTLGAFYSLAFFLMPLYLSNIQHLAALDIGFMLLPTTAGVAIISPFVGKAVDKLGCKPIIIVGLLLLATSATLQAQFTINEATPFILVSFLCMGIGWGCVLSPSMTAAVTSVPQSYTGAAIGNIGTIQNTGASIGLAIGVAIFNSQFLDNISSGVGSSVASTVHTGDLNQITKVLEQQLDLGTDAAAQIVTHGFMTSYSSAMLLLTALCSLSLLVLTFKMKRPEVVLQE
ncbi:MFS transporter [Vibrio brasiliensis]|uniref:Drug transporter, putative n=1 Tax=Vibrio brasiliensis LMG 20546 TaxID=945543 RepID=E8LXT4_9VIBR|nr:MFS transporter [Vibrio brasiliensis]EGA64502.1 drug transporter, putative [Vibrio brasiliensis LMG 20546]MCG9724103.1 MFS transporter [Vibrio brasiliensis]